MATLLILKGLPLSGKTTWANEWLKKGRNRVRISWTDILATMGTGQSRVFKPLAVDAACRLMCQALREGLDVVIDECNLYAPESAPFINRAALMRIKAKNQTIVCGIDEIKRRNAACGHPFCDMELDRLYERYSAILKK